MWVFKDWKLEIGGRLIFFGTDFTDDTAFELFCCCTRIQTSQRLEKNIINTGGAVMCPNVILLSARSHSSLSR